MATAQVDLSPVVRDLRHEEGLDRGEEAGRGEPLLVTNPPAGIGAQTLHSGAGDGVRRIAVRLVTLQHGQRCTVSRSPSNGKSDVAVFHDDVAVIHGVRFLVAFCSPGW